MSIIVRLSEANLLATAADIQRENFGDRTIERKLNEAVLKSYSSAKKCMLNEQRKRTRFLWGQYHSKKSVKEWSTIFFTEKSTFNINIVSG